MDRKLALALSLPLLLLASCEEQVGTLPCDLRPTYEVSEYTYAETMVERGAESIIAEVENGGHALVYLAQPNCSACLSNEPYVSEAVYQTGFLVDLLMIEGANDPDFVSFTTWFREYYGEGGLRFYTPTMYYLRGDGYITLLSGRIEDTASATRLLNSNLCASPFVRYVDEEEASSLDPEVLSVLADMGDEEAATYVYGTLLPKAKETGKPVSIYDYSFVKSNNPAGFCRVFDTSEYVLRVAIGSLRQNYGQPLFDTLVDDYFSS